MDTVNLDKRLWLYSISLFLFLFYLCEMGSNNFFLVLSFIFIFSFLVFEVSFFFVFFYASFSFFFFQIFMGHATSKNVQYDQHENIIIRLVIFFFSS
jgi:hypothetical protein